MQRKKLIIVSIIIVLVGVLAWYMATIFQDGNVDRNEQPLPTVAELEAMSEQERSALRERVLQGYADLPDKFLDEDMPAVVRTENTSEEPVFTRLREGSVKSSDAAYRGRGTATLYALNPANRFIRFEDFFVTQGPGLVVLLAKHPDPQGGLDLGSEDIEIGVLKGNAGNQNYLIPSILNLAGYESVVIYSKLFHTIYAVASFE